nr:alkaline/neutral invertase A, mitochondrial [Ipomoea batatas]
MKKPFTSTEAQVNDKSSRSSIFKGDMNVKAFVAANDPADKLPLNYDQVFIRDFIPSALAFLLNGEGGDCQKIFCSILFSCRVAEKTVGLHIALDKDFGESAIGRVAPVDSGKWMISLHKCLSRYVIQLWSEGEDWRIITGSDPKNTPWSYHNGGSWPTLLWQFTLACIKMGKTRTSNESSSCAERGFQWISGPASIIDTRYGRFVGKQLDEIRHGTVAGVLDIKDCFLKNPDMAILVGWNEDYELLLKIVFVVLKF